MLTVEYIQFLYHRYRKPIWLTEFSCAEAPVDRQLAFMNEILPMLDAIPEVDFLEHAQDICDINHSQTSRCCLSNGLTMYLRSCHPRNRRLHSPSVHTTLTTTIAHAHSHTMQYMYIDILRYTHTYTHTHTHTHTQTITTTHIQLHTPTPSPAQPSLSHTSTVDLPLVPRWCSVTPGSLPGPTGKTPSSPTTA